jgi:hypothetical protein
MSHRLWGITTFYNPFGSRTRLANYRAFRGRSREQGLRLLTVELAFDERPFELREGEDAECLVRRRSDAVLWQKERLLNLALETLPGECTAVCWIDADVLFEDDDWVAQCGALLERHAVLQPFSRAIRLPRGKRPADLPGALLGKAISEGTGEGTYSHAVCARPLPRLGGLSGTTGYAWCAQRSVLQEAGFYDRCIVGGADRELALAVLYPPGKVPRASTRIRYPLLRRHMAPWHERLYAAVAGRVSHRPGVIHHLWHGDSGTRQYRDRHEILEQHDYDPETDVALDAGGCLRWSTRKQALVQAVAAYLAARNEAEQRSEGHGSP